jgi:hypothetical protein
VAGRRETIEQLWQALIVYGMVSHPMESWLLTRGLQTFPFRMERHNANALAIARFLEGRPEIARVHYPGLASHPQHDLAARQMHGFGGMVVFELSGGYERARAFTQRLGLARRAVSLGGEDSRGARRPIVFPHLTPEERRAAGVGPSGPRVHSELGTPARLRTSSRRLRLGSQAQTGSGRRRPHRRQETRARVAGAARGWEGSQVRILDSCVVVVASGGNSVGS